MLLYKEDGGFHNFQDGAVEQAKKEGWIDGAPVWAALIAAKSPATLTAEEPVKIVTHARRGRPRREEQAVTVEVPHEHSPNTD